MSMRVALLALAFAPLLAGGGNVHAVSARSESSLTHLSQSCTAATCSGDSCGDFPAPQLRSQDVQFEARPLPRSASATSTHASTLRESVAASARGVARTPAHKSVQIWFLSGRGGAFGTSAAVTSAVNKSYQPVIRALRGQGYGAPRENVSRFPSTSLRTSVTLGEFVAGIRDAGVLIVDGHATDNGFLPVEVYRNTAAGRKAANRAFRGYRRAGYTVQDLGGSGPTPSISGKTLAIGLTSAGVADHLQGARHALVFLALCHGKGAAVGFVNAGAQAAVYWSGRGSGPMHLQDMADLLKRMDGTALPNPSLESNSRRILTAALGDCNECSGQLSTASAPAEVTLAPAVVSRLPDPRTGVSSDKPFQVRVTFDAAMANSRGLANGVVTVGGCGNTPSSNADRLHWKDNHTIVGKYKIETNGTLTITVHHQAARSVGAETELNGNGGGSRAFDGAMAPNGDDFVWHVPCHKPIVHVVFTGTGTITERSVQVSSTGDTTEEIDTEHLSWTAVWDLDLRTLPPSSNVTPGTYNYLTGVFDPSSSSFNGTATVVSSCRGECTFYGGATTCTGSFTSDSNLPPRLFVLQPPQTDGTIQVFAPPLAVAAKEPCGHDPIQSIPIALGGDNETAAIGPFTAHFALNPATWKPQTISVGLQPAYTSTSKSADGSTTVTFTDEWSGTITLSVPPSN